MNILINGDLVLVGFCMGWIAGALSLVFALRLGKLKLTFK